MDFESLRSLQKRIREAKGADRALDGAIAQTLLGWTFVKMKGDQKPYYRTPDQTQFYQRSEPPRYTLDPDGLGSCVALLEAVLPGCKWERDRCGSLRIWHPDNGAGPSIVFAPANDCLTFLYAIVGALIAQEEAKEKADV